MEKIKNYFEYFKNTKSDINEHMQTLYDYANKCESITEMGVRSCVSSWAFLYTNPKKMISIDLIDHPNINILKSIANEYNINFKFIKNDVLKLEIENTDLLFIDTFHTYNQLLCELELHSHNVNKYIILHDTETYGFVDEPYYDNISEIIKSKKPLKEGLMNAVIDFQKTNEGSCWNIKEVFKNNNGLLILEKEKNEI